MENLKEHHRYLIDYFETIDKSIYGLQEIYIIKVTQKAIRIEFLSSGENQWFDKADPSNKINIFEDITY